MSIKIKLVLLLIISFGAVLRFYHIDLAPASLNWDEVSHGYNAYSIIKTGKDEWGINFPLIFRAYGDYKLPLYIYLSTLPVKLFGLNEFSTRFVSALSGVVLIYLTFLFTYNQTKNKYLGLFGALLISTATWHIFLSRIALEANLFLTLMVASLYLLRKNRFNLSMIAFGFCLFTYNSARIFFVFYLVFILFSYKKELFHKAKLGLLFLLGCLIVTLIQTGQGQAAARYKWTTLLDIGAINKIEEKRNSNSNSVIAKIKYNKPTFLANAILKNYIKIINPSFIFQNGSTNFQFNIPDFPLIQTALFLPFLIGLLFVLKNERWLLYWLVVSPLPSALTRDAPHTLRSNLFIYLVHFTIILGCYLIFKKYKTTFTLVIMITFFQLYLFKDAYLIHIKSYAWASQYGYKQAVTYLNNNKDKYQTVYFTKRYGEPHLFYAFYSVLDPLDFQKNRQSDFHTDWYWTDSFKNIKFVNNWEMINLKPDKNSLVIAAPFTYPPKNANLLEKISNPDGEGAFEIVRYEK